MNQLNNGAHGSIVLMGENDQPFQTEYKAVISEKHVSAQSEYAGWKYYTEHVDRDGYTILCDS